MLYLIITTINLTASQPCKDFNKGGFQKFKHKHILPGTFKKYDKNEFKRYMTDKDLCGRSRIQSFFQQKDEAKVKSICNGGGLLYERNLCVSVTAFELYEVQGTDQNCNDITVQKLTHKVVLACDKVNRNTCLPVHYEQYKNQSPGKEKCK